MSKKKNNSKDSLENLMNAFGKTESENSTSELDLEKLEPSITNEDAAQEINAGSMDVGDTDESLTIDEILANMTANSPDNSEITEDMPVSVDASEVIDEQEISSSENTSGKNKGKKNKKNKKNTEKNTDKVIVTPGNVTANITREPEIPQEDVSEVVPVANVTPEEKSTQNKNKEKTEKTEKTDAPKKKEKKPEKEKPSKKAENKPDKKDKKENKKEKIKEEPKAKEELKESLKNASPMRLIVTLTLICAAVALLLAAVNHFTISRIEENNKKAILASIREIFDESVQAEEIAPPEGSDFTSLYLVMKDGGICGYSAAVSPTGFGGPINLMVGMDSEGKVVGVDVVSMSETPGLGSKTGGTEFLSQFKGASGDINVDAISGATISSTAVADGVRSVTTNLLDLGAVAAKRGVSVVPYVRSETVQTTTVTNAPATEAESIVPDVPVTTVPVVTEAVIGAPDVSKNENPPEIIVQNPGNENPGVYADYTEVTTEFETLTTEPESSDLTTGESSALTE